jgi:hypothetical protein
MYDFNFGPKETIAQKPEEFLVFVKRLLPRWANGIPDSESVAIFRVLSEFRDKDAVLIETGSGASSVALFLHCALYGGKMYSWDTNASKGAFLRSVVSDAIGRVLEVDVHKIWKFIGFDSTDENIGIGTLKELNQKADFGFFDSWHTLEHLMKEVSVFETVASDTFIIALDDAYYKKRYQNFSYINMLRSKLGLSPVAEPADNVCRPFHVEIDEYLRQKYQRLVKVEDSYKANFEKDIFFEYYESDRSFMNSLGMEEKESLSHRFDAWRIS